MSIEKGLIGKEDINLGDGTFQRRSQSGSTILITKLNASHLPILDSASRFTGTDVEVALSECQTLEGAGSPVKTLTNRSGAQRVAGDVVIVDTNNDDSFTTTTTAGDTKVLGVVIETIANGSAGKVATGGYVGSVKVSGATTRGQFLKTHTVATQASPTSSIQQGVFAIALSNGSSTVSVMLFGVQPVNIEGTVTTNLNADKVDGFNASQTPTANEVLVLDSNGVLGAGIVPLDRVRRAEYEYTGPITDTTLVAASYTTLIATASMNVTSGDRLMFCASASIDKGITGGLTSLKLSKTAGTGAIQFGAGPGYILVAHNQAASEIDAQFTMSGILKVTTTGTLTLSLQGKSAGSDATALASEANLFIMLMRNGL